MPPAIDGTITEQTTASLPTKHSLSREFVRLLWKEFLALRGLLALVGMTVALVNGVLWMLRLEVSEETGLLLLSLPQLTGVVFAIGCGAALFSQEHELRTLEFLRGMGVSPLRLVNAKLTAAAACLIVLVALTTATRWRPPLALEVPSSDVMVAVSSCGAALVLLLWTSLWSMLLRRELLTVCSGLGGAVLLKPIVEHWPEGGFVLLCAILSTGLWLLCQIIAPSWMGSGEGPFWRRPLELALNKRRQRAIDESGVPSSPTSPRRVISTTAGSAIAVGIALLLLVSLVVWWNAPQSAGAWAGIFELCWSLLLGAVLGWLPVRCESRSDPRGPLDWQDKLATSSITWSLLWCVLSVGFVGAAFHELSSIADVFLLFQYGWDGALAWLLLSCCSVRLTARLCSGRWPMWPLSILPLGIGWCVWWLLTMTGGAAWMSFLHVVAVLGFASWWHGWATWHERPVWKTNGIVVAGLIGLLGLAWGTWCWWRVAEIPLDWTAGARVEEQPDLTLAHSNEVARNRTDIFRLAALVSAAPNITDPNYKHKDHPCFNADWSIMDGQKTWSDVTDLTRQWIESNEPAIAAALAWQETPQSRASELETPAPSERDEQSSVSVFWSNNNLGRSRPCWILAARRAEASGKLDDAWCLHRLVSRFHSVSAVPPGETQYAALVGHFWHYQRLAPWIEHPQQTSARLKAAITELLADGPNLVLPEVMLTRKFQQERESHAMRAGNDLNSAGDLLWQRWLFRNLSLTESAREAALLDGLEAAHRVAFAELRPLTSDLSASWQGSSENGATSAAAPPRLLASSYQRLTGPNPGVRWVSGPATRLIATTPRISLIAPTDQLGPWPEVRQFLIDEGLRRSTLLVMAERAFELEHGRLPDSADDLVPTYLPQIPRTILTGRDLLSVIRTARRSALESTENYPGERAHRLLWSRRAGAEEPIAIGLVIPLDQPPKLILTRNQPLPQASVGVSH